MEALYNYNIKIVEGNPFALLVPFVKRTFVSCKPIDEDIDVMALEDVVAKFGVVEYPAEKTPGGVLVRIPGTLKPENYDLIVTAKYYGADIRAAYKAVTIVSWNEQSNAQQYVQGSPVVLPAAFYIASLTDAELEQLKQDLRDAIASAEQAEADAEQAKAEWEQKAAELDGVAQQQTLINGIVEQAKDATVAKEYAATENKNEILAAIAANAGIPTLTIPDSTAVQELAPNVLYIFETRTSTLTLTLGTPIVGIANEYHFFVVCGANAPTINFPAGIVWNGGSAPTIAANKTYEVSILNNVAAYFEV